MRIQSFLTVILVAGGFTMAHAMEDAGFAAITQELTALQEAGRFSEADAMARKLLNESAGDFTTEQRRALEFEVERVRRTRMDYTVTEQELIDLIRERIPDLTDEEFHAWDKEGRFDVRVIDGQKLYMNSSRANLFYRYPELKKRRTGNSIGTWRKFIWECYEQTRAQHDGTGALTVEPEKFELTMTITVDAGAVPAGETIRCWMPYGQQFESQSSVELLSASPAPAWINNPTYPMRSLYFEQPSKGAEPTVFQAAFTTALAPRYSPVDPEKVTRATRESFAEFDWFTREQPPHIRFTDEFRALEKEIASGETNPYLRARKYYDWMCDNIVYSFAREYSTLDNISDYVRANGYGDCGQLTLMFMTLCRLGGIPARWQSGWIIYPMDKNLHDWCEIYIEPYGWIPVDVNYGIIFEQVDEQLTAEQCAELQDYYFGGLDAFRFIVNRDHGYPHYPEKVDFRSDTVDFQRGELEAGGRNLYFDQFSYNLDVKYLSPMPGAVGEDKAAPRPQGENLAR
ncbi:MAG: hypothetical protein PWP23_3289 [Candidatus Sumerlaeota bacterium]|nr:hypothetical protein [Candidatus Sumerlaeota bacterium]